MNEINFLPETFVRHRAAKKRRFGHVGIAIMVVAVLVSWWFVERRTLESIRSLELNLQRQVGQAQSELTEVQKLQGVKKLLVHQDRIRRELAQPISHTSVVEMIGQAMPDSITMTDLTMVARRAPLRSPGEAKATKSSATGRNAPRITPVEEMLLVEFSGLAPNDVEIANLVGALSKHVVFSNVKMLYSRSVTTRGVIGREFRMELQVPLDRDYRPHKDQSQVKPQEVAHAN